MAAAVPVTAPETIACVCTRGTEKSAGKSVLGGGVAIGVEGNGLYVVKET